MPTPLSAGIKPKVADRRYLRPTEARRLVEAAGKRGRYPFRCSFHNQCVSWSRRSLLRRSLSVIDRVP
jgi:hypothetical protein